MRISYWSSDVCSSDLHDVFVPLIPAMIVTALWVILVAWYFGLKERARLGRLAAESIGVPLSDDDPETPCATDPARRRYFWINLAIMAALMTALLTDRKSTRLNTSH